LINPPRTALDAMFTIRPPRPAATIALAISHVIKNAPRALTAWILSQWEALASSKNSRSCSATLLTNNHGAPKSRVIVALAAMIDASSARSTLTATA
jgi:hypothetical protein